MSLTPRDVQDVSFSTTQFGRRGYDEKEVDDFLDRVARALAGVEPMTPAEVDEVTFSIAPIGRRGYDEQEVDDFLDRVKAELASRA